MESCCKVDVICRQLAGCSGSSFSLSLFSCLRSDLEHFQVQFEVLFRVYFFNHRLSVSQTNCSETLKAQRNFVCFVYLINVKTLC